MNYNWPSAPPVASFVDGGDGVLDKAQPRFMEPCARLQYPNPSIRRRPFDDGAVVRGLAMAQNDDSSSSLQRVQLLGSAAAAATSSDWCFGLLS